MSGIINQVGARSGIISGGGAASASTVALSGTTGLDYEEGNWSPTIGNGSVYTSGDQNYTKIGNMVFARGYLYNGNSTASSAWQVTGFPYPPNTPAEASFRLYNVNISDPSNTMDMGCELATTNAGTLQVYQIIDGGAWYVLPYTAMTTTYHIQFSIAYFTDA